MAIDILKQTAIHEIGHVVMAYYFDYSVNYTSFDKALPGEGKTEISWKPDNQIINMLINPILASERVSLMSADADALFNLTKKFIMIMTAGTAAEVIYEKKNLGSTSITNINGADNDFISIFIDSLKSIGFEVEDSLVNQCFQVPLSLFTKDSFWNALDYLSDLLLSNQAHRLDKSEIKNYLVTVDFKS